MKSSFLHYIIIGILSMFLFSSCDKEDGEVDNSDSETADNYYVKYVISSNYPLIFSNWSVSTPQGQYTKDGYQTRRWQQTYGPVKKGFNCSVQVRNGQPNIEIYVSKNQEPFSLKISKAGNSASYSID